MANENPDTDLARAWDLYKHMDVLQHTRHSIFLVAQSIFVAAFAATHKNSTTVGNLVVVIGVAYAIFWFFLAYRLGEGMESVRKQYIEPGNPIWVTFESGLKRGGPLSAHLVLDCLFPGVMFLAWILLFIFRPIA